MFVASVRQRFAIRVLSYFVSVRRVPWREMERQQQQVRMIAEVA